jgi:hypothetical protein
MEHGLLEAFFESNFLVPFDSIEIVQWEATGKDDKNSDILTKMCRSVLIGIVLDAKILTHGIFPKVDQSIWLSMLFIPF